MTRKRKEPKPRQDRWTQNELIQLRHRTNSHGLPVVEMEFTRYNAELQRITVVATITLDEWALESLLAEAQAAHRKALEKRLALAKRWGVYPK